MSKAGKQRLLMIAPRSANAAGIVGGNRERSDVHPVHEIESNSKTPMALQFLDHLGADDGVARAR
jgi:hypothetical protein